MTIKPLADKVVVKKLEAEETTKGGLILSSGAQQKPQVAEIIAVGPGGVVDGNEIKMEVTVGQKVIIRDYAGTNVKLDGEEYIVVRQDDIVAIVED
ncbi:MAG: co-chaperone GroES [Clostridiales bacterium]|nr:co-chaperone GroES [Clostridiales bacterium]